MAEPWGLLVRQGNQALLEGRLKECERLAARAAVLAPGRLGPGLLAVAACREQGRAAEAEGRARDVLVGHSGAVEAHALLGAVLADLGRDAEAGRQLDRLDGEADPPPPVSALAAEIAAVLHRVEPAEALHRRLAPLAEEFVPVSGALARHLGLLCHVLGRWDTAEAHFDDAVRVNQAAGAPVLVAHTRRQYSALLRARGDDGDWERAIELLAQAATVYRRLEIDRLAEEAEAVLRRSQELGAGPEQTATATATVFRRAPGGWELSYRDQRAVLADGAGLGHLATLLAAAGRPVHVIDLAVGPGATGGSGSLHEEMLAEYRSRLAELDAQLAGAQPGAVPAAAALARAERDFLQAELAVLTAGAPAAGEVGDRARRLVALRIRTSVDRVEQALPGLGRHLRRSIRTGTFCLYEPEGPQRWTTGP